MKIPLHFSILVGFSALALSTSLPAAVWVGGNNANDWNTGANWDPSGVPGASALADVASGTAVLSNPASSAIERLRIASAVGSSGTVIISSTLISSPTTFTDIARSGTGTLIINAGANFQLNGGTGASLRFGALAAGLGIGNQSGGSISTTGGFFVGVNGTGQYTFSGGTISAAQNFSIASGANSSGTYTQSSGTITIGSTGAGGSMFVGQNGSGTLNISNGRILGSTLSLAPVMGSSTSAVLNQTGGEIDIVNGPNQANTTLGLLIASDRATYSISGGSLLVGDVDMSGDFNVTGNDATITVQDDFSLSATGTITFTFNDEGISLLNVGGNGLFNIASVITVDGSDYTGPNGLFTLIDAFDFNNTPVINLVGFGAGSSYNWDAINGVFSVTVVPEPGTVSLLLGGGILLGWIGCRRRKA